MDDAQRIRIGVVAGANETLARTGRALARTRSARLRHRLDHRSLHHRQQPPKDEEPFFEAWTLMGGLAALTERIRFGVMVTGNTYRNPALLAKEAITLDHISNGRLELGVGAGWWEREHIAYGYDFPGKRELVDRFKEALELLDSLQTQRRTEYAGRYYRMADAPFEPKPVQQPHIPVVIGSAGPRMLALTAKHADIWNSRGPVDVVAERSRLLDDKCREIGREPASLKRSVWPFEHPFTSVDNVRQVVASYQAVGFTDFVFSWPPPEYEDTMRDFAQSALDEVRA